MRVNVSPSEGVKPFISSTLETAANGHGVGRDGGESRSGCRSVDLEVQQTCCKGEESAVMDDVGVSVRLASQFEGLYSSCP